MKNKTFVVGDIHGTYKALKQALERSGINYDTDTLITLGDIVDGHKDTYLCVEELLKIKNRIDIRGNHDDWFLEFIETGIHPDGWAQGGLVTAQSYKEALGEELKVYKKSATDYGWYKSFNLNLIPEDVTVSHQNFFKHQARYYKDDNNNIFIHAGFNRHLPLREASTSELMWDRGLWKQAMSAKSSGEQLKFEEEVNKVFIGHTTTLMWKTDQPIKASNVWNLDTGAGSKGRVTIMDVDTEEFWQSDLVTQFYTNDYND